MICLLQVTITPEVASRSVNRAIMAELVRLYKESALGMRLPAYDGRKSLYTAGELPFAWKEFKIKLVDEEDGINGPKYGNIALNFSILLLTPVFLPPYLCEPWRPKFFLLLWTFFCFNTTLMTKEVRKGNVK